MSRSPYGNFNPARNSTKNPPPTGSRIAPSRSRAASSKSSKSAASTKSGGTGSTRDKCAAYSTTSSVAGPSKSNKKTNTEDAGNPSEVGFVMPAFSLPVKPRKFVEKDKKKHMRRNKPAGEDINKLKEIYKTVKNQFELSVQEYIGLVSPSTGDNGDTFRMVLADEIATFRKLARKIYDTNTQDVSDVLTNEHIQITEGSTERKMLYEERMMRSINTIFMYCPDFQFEKYYTQIGYLEEKFPLNKESEDPEDEESLLRQEAYHRYQWLKTEGERLNEENRQLQARLNELKRQQKQELKLNAMRAKEAEAQHQNLEAQQEELQEKLEELEVSVEKCLVDQEHETVAATKVELKRLKTKTRGLPKPRRIPKKAKEADWGEQAATDIEEKSLLNVALAEASQLTIKSKKSTTGGVRKKRAPPDRSGHFSPLKSPPPREKRPPKEASPFHFSPLKSPPRAQQEEARERSPFHYSPEREAPRETTRTNVSTTVIQQPRGGFQPRDTWGGFG